MRHRTAATVIALWLVISMASPAVAASSTTVPRSDLSASCEASSDPEVPVNFAVVLGTIKTYNEGGYTDVPRGFLSSFRAILRMIAGFNQRGSIAVTDGMRTSSFEVGIANERPTSTTVVVQLRCESRPGSPVVYNETVTVNGNSTTTLVIATDGNASTYEFRIRTVGGGFTPASTVSGVEPIIEYHPVIPLVRGPIRPDPCVRINQTVNASYEPLCADEGGQ